MNKWMRRGGAALLMLLVGAILWTLLGALLGHDPNHGINRDEAREAARRVHPTPNPGFQIGPDKGG